MLGVNKVTGERAPVSTAVNLCGIYKAVYGNYTNGFEHNFHSASQKISRPSPPYLAKVKAQFSKNGNGSLMLIEVLAFIELKHVNA